MMSNRQAGQRYLLFQLYFVLQIACIVIIAISLVALRFAMGLFEFLVIVVPLIGIGCYLLNGQLSRRNRVLDSYYVITSLTCLLSILLTSQLLVRFTIETWYSQFVFFLFILIPVLVVGYFMFFTQSRSIMRAINPVTIIGGVVGFLILAILIYRLIICALFAPSFLLFIAYLIGVIGVLITVVIAFDLRCLIYQGR